MRGVITTSAMRRVHTLPLQRIRKSLLELASIRSTPHPLLDESFETDRVNLCIRDAEAVVSDLAAEYQVDTAVLEDALR